MAPTSFLVILSQSTGLERVSSEDTVIPFFLYIILSGLTLMIPPLPRRGRDRSGRILGEFLPSLVR